MPPGLTRGHVRLDALVRLMIDWPDGEIALQFLERLLHFGEPDVESPQLRRRLSCEIGAQQVPAFVAPAGAQALAVQREGESFRGDGRSGLGQRDGDEAFGAPGFLLRNSDFSGAMGMSEALCKRFPLGVVSFCFPSSAR
jgi:hypothetical protein